jgi:GAF domain-containing protein
VVDHKLLVDVLVRFVRTLATPYQIEDVLALLCREVTDVLPVTGAGVMLEEAEGMLRFVAASDDVVRRIEELQIEVGEGPCLYAYETGEQVIIPDLSRTELLRRFAPRALAAGMAAVYSFPMRFEDQRVGGLNLYGTDSGDFDNDARDAGQLLADAATIYLLSARTLEERNQLVVQLQEALDTRIVIEQAKGKLSAQLGLPADEAFKRLRHYARSNRRRIHDVARAIVTDELRLE